MRPSSLSGAPSGARSKSWRGRLAAGFLVAAALVVVAIAISIRRPPIDYEVKEEDPTYEVLSPDGRYVARYFTVHGPPWRYARRVGIQPKGEALNGARYVVELFSALPPCVSWSGEAALTIEYPGGRGTYLLDRLESTWVGGREIRIAYEERLAWYDHTVEYDEPCPNWPDWGGGWGG